MGSSYQVIFKRSARKELETLGITEINRIFPKIEALARNPRPSGCRKIVGEDNLWRIRSGDYRVIYAIDDTKQIIDILAVRHRRDSYR